MEELIINVRASKTSPHAGQKYPRHLFTLMCTVEEFEKLWSGWTSMPAMYGKPQQLYLARTQNEFILVNPLDPLRIKHYDAVPFTMREDTQHPGRMRGSVSCTQAPWLREAEAQGLSDAELVLQPTTDNYLLSWKYKVAPKKLHKAQNTGPSEILEAASKMAVPPIALSPAVVNSVHLNYSDGSVQVFDQLTLAQMVEIQNLLTRMTS